MGEARPHKVAFNRSPNRQILCPTGSTPCMMLGWTTLGLCTRWLQQDNHRNHYHERASNRSRKHPHPASRCRRSVTHHQPTGPAAVLRRSGPLLRLPCRLQGAPAGRKACVYNPLSVVTEACALLPISAARCQRRDPRKKYNISCFVSDLFSRRDP